jgi:tripartite-type tricarboxylate transporter receptor subunit TctC
VIIVRADAPWANLRAFIEASRTGPGFHFATAGVGSTPHFVAVILNTYYGAQLEPVAYKSGSESATAIASGQVQASSEASIVSQGYLQAGRFRGLATTWVRRLAAFPQLPTALEQGYPELQIAHWAGLHAARGTPAEILDRIAQAVDVAMNSTATAQKLTRLGIEPGAGSRQSFEHFVQQERERLGAVVRRTRMSEQ